MNAAAPTRTPQVDGELTLTLERKQLVADGVVELVLHSPEPLPAWEPGAHIDLVFGDELVRQYSLCGDPADRHRFRVAILREAESRGGSEFAHERLTEEQSVTVRGPRNHFPLVSATRYQFIAGGIGITPMLPMIAAAEAAGADWHLLYGGRQRASMAYVEQLESYGDRVRIQPEEAEGRLDIGSVLDAPAEGTLVYSCGPEPLLRAVEERCESWPHGALHLERFAPKAPEDHSTDTEFDVVFERSGVTATVPKGVSILDVATDHGVFVLRSCSEGICGTCETVLLEGEPDHRDSVLTDDDREADCFMPCVSRCRSARLVLDL